MELSTILLGFLLGALIGGLAYQAGALSASGAVAAALTGGLIFSYGGLAWAALLLAFFLSSSTLSKLFGKRKAALNEKFSKGSRRDWAQVAANGAVGALLALAQAVWPQASWPWAAFAGAMAAVNADTWATELGVLSAAPPRRLTTFQPVERGASGAVSLVGSAAALAGAGLIALLAAWLQPLEAGALLPATIMGGLGGSFFDSFLGATIQAIYWCPQCRKETERHPQHTCGSPTHLQRGWPFMNNDMVNFLASLAGALLALGLYTLWR